MTHTTYPRRRFIRSMLTLAGGAGMPFALNLAALNNAVAQTAGDYKALVCLYMAGGNDGFNTVLATDDPSWTAYVAGRTTGDGTIALQKDSLKPVVPLNPQGRSYALHPQLGNVQRMFNDGRAAIIANVGTLVQPITKAQYQAGSANVPAKLFSHNDQQSLWQSNQTEGAGAGWGGLMVDQVTASSDAIDLQQRVGFRQRRVSERGTDSAIPDQHLGLGIDQQHEQ